MIVMLQMPGQHKAGDAYILARGAGNTLYETWPQTPELLHWMDGKPVAFVRYDGKRVNGPADASEYDEVNNAAKIIELRRLRTKTVSRKVAETGWIAPPVRGVGDKRQYTLAD